MEKREANKVLPQVCTQYEQVLAKAVACEQLPLETRSQLTVRLQAAKAEWAAMIDKSELASVCTSGIRVLKQAAVSCPGSDKW